MDQATPSTASANTIGTAAMAGRSLTASMERGLCAFPELQSTAEFTLMLSRHGDWIPAAFEVFCAEAASTASVSAIAVELVAPSRVSAGASAIACLGSRSRSAMKTARPLAPATNPKTRNARTRPSLRRKLAEPTYPNSGCRSHPMGAQEISFAPQSLAPLYYTHPTKTMTQ
jgi:hypothetical protein